MLPDTTLAECPPLDLLCVPGGPGVAALMEDAEVLDFLRRQASGARYVTSVCTGALVLGAAGLLRGKRATTHWASHDFLAAFGATPVRARVVRDGKLFTGGGVTAGIDFALTIAAEIAGPEAAQAIQLGIEYAPAPPFSAGSPESAPAAVLDAARGARRGDAGGARGAGGEGGGAAAGGLAAPSRSGVRYRGRGVRGGAHAAPDPAARPVLLRGRPRPRA